MPRANHVSTTALSRRSFLSTSGTALAASAVTLPVSATTAENTLSALWAERQKLAAEQAVHWAKFKAVRDQCDDLYPVGGDLPGVWFPDRKGGVTLPMHLRDLFDSCYRYECRNMPEGRTVAEAMEAALERAKAWDVELRRQAGERHANRERYEDENGGTAAWQASSDLVDRIMEIDDRIAAAPAATLADLAVKARLAADWRANWNSDSDAPVRFDRESSDDDYAGLLAGIVADAERLAAGQR